jgi:regulatory protein
MTGGHDTGGAPRTLGKSEDNAHDLDKCQEAALRLLDASARSVRDMQERLLGKGYDPSVVERVVGNLIRVGLLDDQAYARGLVEHCLGRLLGARGTERELLRKGVPRRIAHDAVQDAEDAGRFAVAADELAQKTARRTQGLDRETRLRRFWSAGGRKGHSPQDLRAAADRYLIDES